MAILGALSIARSGLIATGNALSVTGNNIANVNTIAFKGSRSEFADLLAGVGTGSIGLGTRLAAVSASFSQGGVESTGRATDIAIQGNGFFVVRDGTSQLYTRKGNFTLNPDGSLATQTGLPLQGYALDANGSIVGPLTDVSFDGATSQPSPTSTVDVKNNLDATATVPATTPFDGATWESAYASSNTSTTVKVFDSLGVSHDLTIFFSKTADNEWDVNVLVDGADVGGTAGTPSLVGTAALVFNPDGSLNAPVPTDLTAIPFAGADPQTITFNFGTPNTTPTAGEGLDGLTQFGSASSVSADGDGYGAGQLQALSVGTDGTITGVFDNGESRDLYRLGLADFTAPDGLIELGDGLYRDSTASGAATVGTPGSSGMGTVVGAAIERSNVDLAQEFVDLISLQRSFQANSRVITTADGLLNDLINIVR
ncbi:MAG: flagellar hook protein FlgE [Deltaproteobacteria bacterium]|nr:flagellar hook protein FlgE [Deltaproteobacteria bacterium]